MLTSTTIDWDFLEVEEEEWCEILIDQAAPPEASSPGRWRRTALGAGVTALVAVSIILVSFWLWSEAQRSLAVLEGEVRAQVHVETLRHNEVKPSARVNAAVQSVDINLNGLMVCVTVTETLGTDNVKTYSENRFYTPYRSGWRRSAPLTAFWGKEVTLDTANLHFAFYERDRQVVESAAQQLDEYVCVLRGFLGLPPLAKNERIAITVVPSLTMHGTLAVDGALLQPSPLLLRVPAGESSETLMLAQLRSLLLARTLDEAFDRAGVRAEWLPIVSDLHWWLEQNSFMLSTIEEVEESNNNDALTPCRTYPASILLLENVADYALGYSGYRSTLARNPVSAFFDFLVSGETPASVPKLLAAFGRHATWHSLAPEVFDMSFQELRETLACK